MINDKFVRLIRSFLLLVFSISLIACGSSSKNESTKVDDTNSSTPDTGVELVDNSGSADYKIIIYGNSHSVKLGLIFH